MKNTAMQHAIAKAHTKAEEHKKGDTLSLPHNKRASDADAAQKPAAANMPEADKVLQQAAQALHDGVNNVTNIDADIPRIVVRQGLRGELYVFFVDSEDRAAGTIELFDVAAGKAEKEVVKVEFYKQATRPVDGPEKDKAIKAVTKTFNVSRVISRSRLVKEGSLGRDDEGKANTVDVDAFKQRLIEAVTKAILAA